MMVAIVIPNYNGIRFLKICLDSIFNQSFQNFIVIIVDNKSTDNSVDFIRSNYSQVVLIENDKNYGFSKAVNIGIEKSLADFDIEYILLLNNDIECDVEFVQQMVSGFVDEKCGSVAAKMMNFYSRNKFDDTGDFVKKWGLPFPRGQGEDDKGQYNKQEIVFGPCAGAAMYKREVFETVGLFDEEYFAYYEDVDFSFRMNLFGFKCWYNPKAVCYHIRGGSFGKKSNLHIYLIERNFIFLTVKNFPFKYLVTYLLQNLASYLKRFISYFINDSFSFFLSAIRGFLAGMIKFPILLRKRKIIYNDDRVDANNIFFVANTKTQF